MRRIWLLKSHLSEEVLAEHEDELSGGVNLDQLLLEEMIKKIWVKVGRQFGSVTGISNFERSEEGLKRITSYDRDRLIEYSIKETRYGNNNCIRWEFHTREGVRLYD